MKKSYLLLSCFVFVLMGFDAFAQPSPALTIDSIFTTENATIQVAVKVDNNDFWNITTLNGTIDFDPSIISYSSLDSATLFQMGGSNFDVSQIASGIISWTWSHPITVGQSANYGDVLFILEFDVIGSSGTGTDLSFVNSPQALFWNNFAGWQGTILTSDGYVSIGGCTAPVSNYTATTNDLSASFTNVSTYGNNPSFSWDFGDSQTSIDENPSHTYANVGTYDVCLTVLDDCDQHIYCKNLEVCFDPTADFTFNAIGFGVIFADVSTYNGQGNYFWDFGDASPISNQSSPTHFFADTGYYEVCLVLVDDCGSDTLCQGVYVCQPALPNFSSTGAELTKSFTNTTVFTLPPTFSWNFGDGNTSTDENPSHTYASAGTYSVCLLTDDDCGPSSSYCKNVQVCEVSNASFGSAGDDNDWTFTNTTPLLFGQTFAWDFGDGNSSIVESPNHTYTEPGNYEVCLMVMDTCGSDTICETITVLNWINTNDIATKSIWLSPNPSNGKIRVQSNAFDQGEKLVIRLIGLDGKTVISLASEYQKAGFEIDLRNEFTTEGIYILELEGQANILHQKLYLIE